ncbi:MAG: sigma-70 family RNA polymerase sigma factor [Candidatus Ventricola sp.]
MNMLTDQQRRMVEENLPLVTFVMNERIQYVRRDEWDDVFQEDAIGLCRAALLFRAEQGVKFASFAVPCIVNAIYAYLRKLNSKKSRFERESLRLEDYASAEMSDKLRVNGLIAAVEDVESEFAFIQLMDFITTGLSDRDSRVVLMLLDGKRQIDIAESIGVSQGGVSRIIRRIEKRVQLYRLGYMMDCAS